MQHAAVVYLQSTRELFLLLSITRQSQREKTLLNELSS